MTVIYRITSIKSTNPSPIYQDDKDELNELCLESFLTFFDEVKPHIIFLADHTSKRTDDMVWRLCSNHGYKYELIKSESDINQTMIESYKLASMLDDYVLFNECDHLWGKAAGKVMLQAIKELGLVSGYDHPDFYTRFDIHPKETEVRLVADHHFRKSARNVMSWGCHSSLVKDNLEMLVKHGYLDDQVWIDLRNKGHQLWTALPAFSTHMVKEYMAPGVEWKYEI